MQRGCTAAQRAVTEGVALEAPVSLSEHLENEGLGRFSKTRGIKFEREIAASGDRQTPLQARPDVACRRITGFHSLTLEK